MFTPPPIANHPLHILCCTDALYAAYCGVTATSVLESCKDTSVAVHIITDGIKDRDKELFGILAKTYGASIDITTIPAPILENLAHNQGRWPRSICFRLLAPDLLPDEINRIIYLDCDIIANTDLRRLWTTDMAGYAIAAVSDIDRCTDAALTGMLSALRELPQSRRYFNSGVMLMDLAQMRQTRVHDKMLRLIYEAGDALPYPDQDALNLILHGQWKRLPCEWNLMPWALVKSNQTELTAEEQYSVTETAIGHPRGIIHFYGPYHPWDCRSLIFHPMEHLWEHYRRMSPWRHSIRRIHPSHIMTRFHRQRLRMCWKLKIPTVYDTPWIDIPRRS